MDMNNDQSLLPTFWSISNSICTINFDHHILSMHRIFSVDAYGWDGHRIWQWAAVFGNTAGSLCSQVNAWKK